MSKTIPQHLLAMSQPSTGQQKLVVQLVEILATDVLEFAALEQVQVASCPIHLSQESATDLTQPGTRLLEERKYRYS